MSKARPHVLAENVIAWPTDTALAAQALAHTLRTQGTWQEVVAGLDSVAVMFDPQAMSPEEAAEQLESAARVAKDMLPTTTEPLEIKVNYGGSDGPDLAQVCAGLGLSEVEFISRHSAATYTAEMIGFTPGFAYLGGLDPALSVPRLAKPRLRVPAGSVGISGAYCGLYALQGPGGWPLIGRTDAALFDAARSDPFLIHPGRKIRFLPA